MKDVILYHGSRGGLCGPIAPISREKTDFGKGFYLGTNAMQAKGLISTEADAIFYTMKLRLSEIPEDRILTLSGQDWLYTVLANRKKWDKFSKLAISKDYLEYTKNYDVIIGPIADDRMNASVQAFIDGSLSDVGLYHCLQSVDYGIQHVLKTPFACEKTDIISSYEMPEEEKRSVYEYCTKLRDDGDIIVENAVQTYRRQGMYFDELIQQELESEKTNRENNDYDR